MTFPILTILRIEFHQFLGKIPKIEIPNIKQAWPGGAPDPVPIISCVLIRTGPHLIRGLHKSLPVILKFLEDRLPEIHGFLERSINFPPITGFSCGPALYSYIDGR